MSDRDDEDLECAERRVLEGVDALSQDRVRRTPEGHAEGCTDPGLVLGRSVRVMQSRLEQLELDRAALTGIASEFLADRGGKAVDGETLEHGAMVAHARRGWRDRRTRVTVQVAPSGMELAPIS